jgi:FkbM family methyltransferase
MTKSDFVLALAVRLPGLAKLAVSTWVRLALLFSRRAAVNHWLVASVLTTLSMRIAVWTRLANGLKIRVAWNDLVGSRIYERGCYEQDTVRLIETLVEPGSVVLDVGAHVGQYSLIAGQRVGVSGQVHSFEPDPGTFAWLAGNVRANHFRNITVNQCAVGADQEPKRLYFSTTDDIGSNSLVIQKPSHRTGRSALVNCTTLDAYASAKALARVDVIKADVEGAELAMLQGARRILGSPTPPILILEFEEERQRAFGSSNVRLAEELAKHGYTLWRIGESLEPYYPSPSDPPSINVLAVHPSRRALLDFRSITPRA